jgi:ABC-type polysaccharide/polyol phosphate transport system ATPase subunit
LVSVHNVSKLYPLYSRPIDRLLDSIPFVPGRRHRDFWALRGVDFEVKRGESFAIVGPNGCGKSTLLQVISGILQPTHGRVHTRGRIAALLELGAGFNPEFTGRENVFLNGEIMGLGRSRVQEVFPKIAEFAGIGEFMDRPVKEYSSGMYVRLAFATAIHVEPEILIVDEALAVGDAVFANRCIRKFEELRDQRVTVLFVSHDLGLVKRLADRAMLLVGGRVEALGAPSDVVNRYIGLVLERGEKAPENDGPSRRLGGSYHHGDGSSRILSVQLFNSDGNETYLLRGGETATVRVRARFQKAIENPQVGLLIRNRLGVDIYGTNTRLEDLSFGRVESGEVVEVEFAWRCLLTRQEYTITVATQHADGSSQDWVDDALSFSVVEPRDLAGVANLEAKVSGRRSA